MTPHSPEHPDRDRLPDKVSDLFDPTRWRVVEGFDFEDLTYHRQVERDAAVVVHVARPVLQQVDEPDRPAQASDARTRWVPPPGRKPCASSAS